MVIALEFAMTAAALPLTLKTSPSVADCVGRVLIVAGLCFGAANLVQWAVVSGAFHLHPAVLGLSWPAAVTVFLITVGRIRKTAGDAGRRVAGWSRLGVLTLICSALALLAASVATGDWGLMAWNSMASPMAYGAAWGIAALRAGRPNMALPSLIGFGGAAAVAATVGTADQYLACATTLALVAFLPGAALARGLRI